MHDYASGSEAADGCVETEAMVFLESRSIWNASKPIEAASFVWTRYGLSPAISDELHVNMSPF